MLNTINNHKSIRKFTSEKIDNGILTDILKAGTRASTTGNMQLYSIVVTSEPEIKEKLWETHFKQNMVLQAPIILTFCADFNRFNKWCNHRNAVPGYDNFLSFFTAATDALLVAQNVAIAAEAYGLGICYLGTTTYNAEKIVEILDLPSAVVPVTTIVMGYPDESPGLTDRIPLEGVIHNEKYSDYTEDAINKLYSEKENLDQSKELLIKNNKETLAQVFTDNRYTKKDNVLFSNKYLQVIRRQGFMNQ